MMIKAVFYSILPSPYQRDLFYSLSKHPEIELQVKYFQRNSTDSPWTEQPLHSYEEVLPGFRLTWQNSHFYINWHLPDLKEADVVVLNGYLSLTAQIILRQYAQNTPCIFWAEKMMGSFGGLKGKLQTILANSLEKSWGIAAIGSKAYKDYQQRFPNKPIFNIPYYCNLSPFMKNIPERPRMPPTILFCGQMIPRKGVDLLLKAFDNLRKKGLTARLLLVGWKAQLPQMLSILPEKTRQQIEYAGFQPPENLPYFFQQADLFVLPSRYDGWGVVVNQAIGAGLPVLCSDAVGAAYDLINFESNGSIFPVENTEALTEYLAYYIQNPETLKKASAYSQKEAKQWLPTVGAQQWVDTFHKIMNDK